MTRNVTMGLIGALSLGALLVASMGLYRLFSYAAAGFILAVIAAAAIEQNDRDLAIAPYTGMVAGLAVIFLAGLTGIWLTWDPTVTEYTYVLGVPLPTLIYFGFLWLLPTLAAIYYAVLFDRIAGEEIVDDIIDEARERQRREAYPLTPDGITPPPEAADGGEVADE